MAGTRVRMICRACGSEDVMHDAWAVWDTRTQGWVLGTVFDYMHCDDCEGEAHIEEVRIEEAAPELPGALENPTD